MAPDRGTEPASDSETCTGEFVSNNEDGTTDSLIDTQSRRMEVRRIQAQQAKHADEGQNFTIRGVLVGLGVGLIICFSNMYFGLQRNVNISSTLKAILLTTSIVGG
jgi:hypothetical protein